MLASFSKIKKTAFTEITTNVTTTSVGPASAPPSLLSVSMFVNPNCSYLIYFSMSGTNSGTTNSNYFSVLLDGLGIGGPPWAGSQYRSYTAFGHSAVISHVLTNLSVGVHTIEVGWAVSAGTGRISAATDSTHHAFLLVEEIAA